MATQTLPSDKNVCHTLSGEDAMTSTKIEKAEEDKDHLKITYTGGDSNCGVKYDQPYTLVIDVTCD